MPSGLSVHIYYSQLSRQLSPESMRGYLNLIPPGAAERIPKFHRWQDAQASLFGFLLLAEGLKEQGWPGKEMVRQINYVHGEKPAFSVAGPEFNISHTEDMVVCAICSDQKIGIDVEKKKNINIDDFNNCWCEEELAWLQNAPDPEERFYYLWTRKEAVIKAFGKGFSYSLPSFNVLHAQVPTPPFGQWWLHPILLPDDFAAHLAIDSRVPVDIIIREMKFI